MKILLVRHGITDWNKLGKFQGRTDSDLSPEGYQQALNVAQRLTALAAPLIIFSSPLKRAHLTALKIAQPHNLTPVILPELIEINFGNWEGQSLKMLEAERPLDFKRWKSDPFFNPPDGAETWHEITARLEHAINIIKSSGCERVIAVTHGGIIRAIFAILLGLSPHAVWNIEVFNCSLSCIEINPHNEPSLLFSNDCCHLTKGVNLF